MAGLTLSVSLPLIAQNLPITEIKPKLVSPLRIGFNGEVTNITGNVITLMDKAGNKRILEIMSVAGIQIGAIAICEEDCGRGIKIGDKFIQVRRIIQ